MKAKEDEKSLTWIEYIHHGIMGDGNIRVLCHKQSLPEVYERLADGTIKKVNLIEIPEIRKKYGYETDEDIPMFEWGVISFEYKGYKFYFYSGEPNSAEMTEPDVTYWECEYDYGFGAGFEDTDD